jgi:hypothetical protein
VLARREGTQQAASRLHTHSQVPALFNRMVSSGMKPRLETFNLLLAAHAQQGVWFGALTTLRQMASPEVRLSTRALAAMPRTLVHCPAMLCTLFPGRVFRQPQRRSADATCARGVKCICFLNVPWCRSSEAPPHILHFVLSLVSHCS